jgi:septum formation topological specificity factor MinE
MAVKKVSTSGVNMKIAGLKEIKKDILKAISKLDLIEQNMINLSVKIKKLEERVGIPR